MRYFDDESENVESDSTGELDPELIHILGGVHSNVSRGLPRKGLVPKVRPPHKHSRKEKVKSIRRGFNKILNKNGL